MEVQFKKEVYEKSVHFGHLSEVPTWEGRHQNLKRHRTAHKLHPSCAICGEPLRTKNPYVRFCQECKEHSELYKYADSF